MPLLTKIAGLVTCRSPKFISPRAHQIADFAITGGFLLGGLAYWKRDRQAAIASLLCGGSMFALTSATNYARNSGKGMTFSKHCRTEMGMATAFSMVPGILHCSKMAKTHLLLQAAALIEVGNLTGPDVI